MKRSLPAALAICLSLSTPMFAAEKKARKPLGKPGATKSKMIVIPPPPDPAIQTGQPAKLITSEMSGNDLLFFTKAVEAGRLQVYLVDLLQTRADSEQIKALGSALSSTQEEENKQIARLAAQRGWNVSTAPTPAQMKLGEELTKQEGSHFDKAVMDRLIAASQQSVVAYESAAQSSDQEIKLFAEQMLPLAKEKLQFAEKMTGAGKAASGLFRTGAPPKATPAPAAAKKTSAKKATPTKGEPAGAIPPAIVPSVNRAVANPAIAPTAPSP